MSYPMHIEDLDIRIQRYRLSATYERVWEVEWKSAWCVHRWLVVALWKARKRHMNPIDTTNHKEK